MTLKGPVLATLVALSLGVGAAACTHTRANMPAPGTAPSLKVLVFYDPSAEKPRGTVLPLIAANRAAISDLAPLWYKVMPDGSVRDLSTNNLKTFAAQNHIRLMPLVINYNGTSAFLENSAARSRAVASLAKILSQQPGYAGLNIDFELLKNNTRNSLTTFMQELHAKTAAMGKQLTIDVIPAGSRRQADRAYDFPALANNADEVVLMTYDAHDDGSAAGAVAPLAWVRQRVDLALRIGVPPSKLVVGLADYGYNWSGTGHHATTVSLMQAQTLAADHHATVKRTADGSPHFTYTTAGVTHQVWYEDGRSILPKIQLARQKKVQGLALWMGGYEDAAYWHALRAAAGTLPTAQSTNPPSSTVASSTSTRSASHSGASPLTSGARSSGSASRSSRAPSSTGSSASSASSRSASSGSSAESSGAMSGSTSGSGSGASGQGAAKAS